MFLHINHRIVLPHNHFFKIKILLQDTDPLHMLIGKDIIHLLTTFLHLTPQTIVIFLLAVQIIQNMTRAPLGIHYKTQPISFEIPHDHLFPFLQ